MLSGPLFTLNFYHIHTSGRYMLLLFKDILGELYDSLLPNIVTSHHLSTSPNSMTKIDHSLYMIIMSKSENGSDSQNCMIFLADNAPPLVCETNLCM